jgi:hypothetical protein
MLPEAPPQEPPRPLVAGAFLRQEFEIKSLLSRGITNIYAAQSGDYGATAAKLIAERDVPRPQPAPEPAAAPVASTQSEVTTDEVTQGVAANADSNVTDPATSVDDAAGSGAFVKMSIHCRILALPQDDAAGAVCDGASSAVSPVTPVNA